MGIIGEVVVGEASETVHIGIVEGATGGEPADADPAGQNKSCDARRAACVLRDRGAVGGISTQPEYVVEPS